MERHEFKNINGGKITVVVRTQEGWMVTHCIDFGAGAALTSINVADQGHKCDPKNFALAETAYG